jgi:hypothetical protein
VGLLKGMLARALLLEEGQQLYSEISEALNQVIVYGSDRTQVALLQRLFVQTLDDLDSFCHIVQQGHIRFVVQIFPTPTSTALSTFSLTSFIGTTPWLSKRHF